MGLYNLDKIFNPKTVAVIGASQKAGTIGNALMTNLIQGGFEGNIIPVNPKYSEIHGLKTFKSVSEVEGGVDLAIIAAPMAATPSVVEECVRIKAGGAIIISAGGKEIGEAGREVEEKIRKTAYAGGLRIVGPNCLGIICPGKKLNASFASDMPGRGKLAFISQSGGICTSILDLALKENIGFSHFVSIGSMLDMDFGDMIDYLGNDPSAGSILLYVENLIHFRKFMSAARSVSRIKPIVVLKSGRSAAGARAASSHTGAMAGEDVVYDTAFKRAGIVRVNTIEELFDCAELMAKRPRPAGSRLAIITNGGGPGVMATDELGRLGVEPAAIPPEILSQLNEFLPPFWSRNNPMDILGDASVERFMRTIEICLENSGFDGALAIMAPQALTDPAPVAEALAEYLKTKRHPVFACWMGGKRMASALQILNQAEVPTYETPERAIRAFLYMVQYSKNLEMLREIPSKLSRHLVFDREGASASIRKCLETETGFLSEIESKKILAAYGIPVNLTELAQTADQAVSLARGMNFPLVMKLISPDISHKTDADGVQLDLKTESDIRNAFDKIMAGARAYNPGARILGVSVQSQILKPDYELLIGAKKDENFGPVILFGMGGIFTEVLKDRAIGLPPLNRLLARRMMEETRAFSLLKGYRGRPPANLELLEELLIRLSQLMVDFPEIVELDMNPVIVKDGVPCAVDGRILLKPNPLPSSLHLVISPYPQEYEFHDTTVENIRLFVRPIKPEDGQMFLNFFSILSPTTIYYRFFSALKILSPAMLERFTQIDYDREISLVALDDSQDEKMLGVARVIGDPDVKKGEFSVLIGDPWHGQGIGATILRRCLQIARDRGMETVWGTVLSENRHMLALGKKLGFTIGKGEDASERKLTIDLRIAEL